MTKFTKHKFIQKMHTAASEIRMTDAERSRVLMALHAKMQERAAVPSPFFIRNPFFARAAVAFVLVVMVSGGTAFAAEGSLPGDPLYAVKVSAVEPIEGAFQVSNTAKAEWNAQIATRRLDEAQTLASKGALTQSASDELAANFNEHATAVEAAAQSIAVADPASGTAIATQFSTSVAARGAAILVAGQQSTSSSSAKASGALVVAIATDEDAADSATAAPVASLMKTATVAPTSRAEAANLSTAAHTALSNAKNAIATHALTKDSKSAANAKAASIANRIVKADAELSIGSTSDAVADFNHALHDITALTQNVEQGSDAHVNLVPTLVH